ncbi:ATP synthase subunit a [Pararhodospirillum photometricum DSM 122]|uniref:ATP synthase subunit a n=1 Tax=Pararhodospirillum photometricum DSM 122 TaxID=1150469 RepID=H6SMB6_PARPM|nr:ATP synthase subunit a [Pararhodospirillum photometricum DSM 122]
MNRTYRARTRSLRACHRLESEKPCATGKRPATRVRGGPRVGRRVWALACASASNWSPRWLLAGRWATGLTPGSDPRRSAWWCACCWEARPASRMRIVWSRGSTTPSAWAPRSRARKQRKGTRAVASPVEQFAIKPLVPIHVAGLDLSFTNSSLMMVAAVALSGAFFWFATARRTVVPGRLQSVAELMYEFIANMIRDNVGKEGMKYFPYIFTLFVFVFLGNMIGMLPYSFTFTSHIAVTAGLAIAVFVVVTIIGFARHGTHYLRMFFPHGAPLATAPILIPIELISYLSRPFSLSVRLFANMTVGHIMLKVLAGFVVALGIVGGLVPFAVVLGITVLEFFIAALQAYVFTILTCIYLNDAINMH